MKILLGLLGDPAKSWMYDNSFYSLHQIDSSNSTFYLIGASETNVSAKQYKKMYHKFIQLNQADETTFGIFSRVEGVRSRIGLFPSSPFHLIRGPSFMFAPIPINSSSIYLKYKAKFLYHIVNTFSPRHLVPIHYLPFGGLAADRTKANRNQSTAELTNLIRKSSKPRRWLYIEAGSGQQRLPISTIQELLASTTDFSHLTNIKENRIIPRTIYGGGINSLSNLDNLMSDQNLVPNCIIVGNVSEEDISITRKIVERISEINNNYFQ